MSPRGKLLKAPVIAMVTGAFFLPVFASQGVPTKRPSETFLTNSPKSLIPLKDLVEHLPYVGAVEALHAPKSDPTSDADKRLHDDDRIIGLTTNGASRAYPVRILKEHSIVNDDLGGAPIAVVYSSASAEAFDRRVSTYTLNFGVSGLLYKGRLVLYDMQTGSLWLSLKAQAVSGPLIGARLKRLPLRTYSWKRWKKKHPDSTVLSPDTGKGKSY